MVGALAGAGLAGATTLQAPIFLAAATFFAACPSSPRWPSRRRFDAPLGYARTLYESGRALPRDPAAAFMILFGMAFGISGVAGMLLTQPFLQRHGVPLGAFGLFVVPVQLLSIAGALVA